MALFSRRPKSRPADEPATEDSAETVAASSIAATTGTDSGASSAADQAGAPASTDPDVTESGASADAGTASGPDDAANGPADTGPADTDAAGPADRVAAHAVDAESAADGDGDADGAAAVESGEPVPHVNISVSTYGKPASSARPAQAQPHAPAQPRIQPPAEAPAPTEKVPGLPDNVVLRGALAELPEKPGNRDIMNAMRQTLQGNLYVRVRGDARTLLAEGKELTLAVSAIGDQRFMLAFTGGEALQRSIASDGDTATSAVGQPAQVVLRNSVAGPYAGLIIDHATPQARIILPKQLVEKSLEQADEALTIKNLLSKPRTDATAADVADALTRVKFWVAAGKAEGSEQVGLAEVRTQDGERLLQIYSHPLEIIVQGRDERPLPLTGEQLGKALAADPAISGILIDPSGPWIKLSRADLAPVIALAG